MSSMKKDIETLQAMLFLFWVSQSVSHVCLGAGSRQYCRYTISPLGITPLKEIWESPQAKENLTSVGFEPTISGFLFAIEDLPHFRQMF